VQVMLDDEEAQDVVDVQPSPDARRKASRAFPWMVLIVGVVLSAVLMAAITISTVPLSIVTARSKSR
jgi:hypothetical protein